MKIILKLGPDPEKRFAVKVVMKDDGKYNSAVRRRWSREMFDIMNRACRDFVTEKDFVSRFEFYIQPRVVQGVGEEKVVGVFADYKVKNGCTADVSAMGLKLFNIFVNERIEEFSEEGGKL